MRNLDFVFTIFCFAYCPWCAKCSLYNCGLGFESNGNAFYASDPHCVPCEEGKFKNTYGPGLCVACPGNFSTSTRGSYYCDACELGFKMVFESTLKCEQCNPCYTTYTKTDEFCRPCRVQDIGDIGTCPTLELHGQGCWSYLTKDEIHKQYLKEFENYAQELVGEGDNSPMEIDATNTGTITASITDDDLKKYMLTSNDLTVPMVLRLQDPDFFRQKREQWWNKIKQSNTYNGYTYTVGPLLPFGSSLKQVFNTTRDTLEITLRLRQEFMNKNDIDKKFVDIEFLQFYSADNVNVIQQATHYTDVREAVSRYHPGAAFPIKIHEVGTNLSKNFDFSGEVYKAMLKILKLSKPPDVCLDAHEPYNVECQAQRYGMTWENVDSTVEHYELEKKIKDNIPEPHDKDYYCDFNADRVVQSYWYWFCTFGSTFKGTVIRERSIRPFYQATNYTLYNATKFYEAASRDIRHWEQKNIDFYECTDPGNHAQDFSGNSVNLTLDFVPEARGQIREISIYTMSNDNKKQFLYCNRSVSDVAMTIQILHTSTFFIQVQFFENQFLYNVTMNQADLSGAWTVNHGTIDNRSDSLSYKVSHTSDSVAVNWTMQESACEAGSSSEILTVSDFHFLYRTMEPELCRK